MNIVCVGHATYDITVIQNQFIKENTKTRFPNITECGGGAACNAAYLLGKWGMNVFFLGSIGKDEYGMKIKQELQQANVNIDYLKIFENEKTSTSLIIANSSTGTRTVLSYHLRLEKLKNVNLSISPNIILIDGYEYDLSLSLLEQYKDAITIMDVDELTQQNIDLAKKVDFVICSNDFASAVIKEKITNDNLQKAYLKVKQYFNNVIITLEDKGCLYEYNGEIKMMPSIDTKPVDSTAAGDIFHGAFVYAIANHYDYEDAILFSNVAAGLSVSKIGSRNSVFPLKEVLDKYHEYR